MSLRLQRTLAAPAGIHGFGLFHGADAQLTFLPAPENHGIAFQRVDLPDAPRVPALIQYVLPTPRRTTIGRGNARVELVEHVLAALAGLRIDNCLVQLNSLEPPGLDGSAQGFVDVLTEAGIVTQTAPRRTLVIESTETISTPRGAGQILMAPAPEGEFSITFDLDYRDGPIGRQSCHVNCTPESFANELAFARTFVLWTEAEALRSKGIGARATVDNVILFGPRGPIGKPLHKPNECARHKTLDCVGDFALLGCDIVGRFHARQSGHSLNHDVVRRMDELLREGPRRRAAG